MRYATHFLIRAAPADVFEAMHRYQVERNPTAYFLGSLLGRIVHMGFQVVSPNALGMGATYDWRFTLLGMPVFRLREEVVEWDEGRAVGYRAARGWNMEFRTELAPVGAGTMVDTSIEFSTGLRFLDRAAKPLFETGLRLVSAAMIKRGLASRHHRARNEQL